MILHPPLTISSRLLPAVRIGDAWISLEPGGVREDRIQWTYHLDVPGQWSHSGDDLFSAPQYTDDEAGYRAAMGALLAFLEAAAESYPDGENADLFPPHVVEWAMLNSDELGMLRCQIEEETC